MDIVPLFKLFKKAFWSLFYILAILLKKMTLSFLCAYFLMQKYSFAIFYAFCITVKELFP